MEILEEKLAQSLQNPEAAPTSVQVRPQSSVDTPDLPLQAASAKSDKGNCLNTAASDWHEVVRKSVRSEREVKERQNKVILAGLPESIDDISAMLKSAFPEMTDEIRSTVRLGHQPLPWAPSYWPRLVKVVFTARGKSQICQKRQDLKHGETSVFVNNDLSLHVPECTHCKSPLSTYMYKALLAAGVRCSLPRDKNLQNGEPTQSDAIDTLLKQ